LNPSLRRLSKWLIAAALVSISTLSIAQTIIPGVLLEARYPTFSADVVRTKQIESATIRLMRKPSSRTIYDDGRRVIYHFNTEGDLSSLQKVNPGPYGSTDTVSTTWIRMNGELQAKAERVGNYRRRIGYAHVNDSTVIETIKVKRGAMEWQEIAQEQVSTLRKLINGDVILIEMRGGIDAKPYQRIITTIGPQGIEGRESWLGARVQYIEEWHYRQRMVSEYTYRNLEQNTVFTLTYSTDQPLQDEGQWCENGSCRNWSVVYYDDGLPKGWIIIDPETQDLEIWEFRYRFR